MCLRPALRPRRARPFRDKAIAVGRHGPTHSVRRGLSTRGNFGAPSHGISTRCLRFAVRISPPHARLASGCGPGSTRRDWLPAGFLRKVSMMLLTSLPPFPSFLAQTLTPLLPQDSLLAAGQALPDGIGYPQGSYERFLRCSLHRFPLSQASWRNE
jgi:hypothetical protein